MYARKLNTEQLYTLEEASEIIKKERSRKIKRFMNKMSQKLLGLFMIVISIIFMIAYVVPVNGDGTAPIVMIIIGLCLLLTKNKITYW